MKKLFLYIFFAMAIFTVAGCSKPTTKASENETKTLAGYIVIKDNDLYFDEVEIITREDKERIEELGLTEEKDYPSGYYILNNDAEEAVFKLTDKTEYTFTDMNLDFVSDAESDRLYTTTKTDEFLKHLGARNDIPLSEQQIPCFVKIQNGNVISITEEFEYTI